MEWTLTLVSLVAYCAGLFMLLWSAGRLVRYALDSAQFLALSALAIPGAMLVFGAIGVIDFAWSGALGALVLDALLLVILGIVVLRASRRAFRPPYGIGVGSDRGARIAVGLFLLLLVIMALLVLILLFKPQ
jgi:hypothetical protein